MFRMIDNFGDASLYGCVDIARRVVLVSSHSLLRAAGKFYGEDTLMEDTKSQTQGRSF